MATQPIFSLVGHNVDQLGAIKAQIADLEIKRKELEARIKHDAETTGEARFDGNLFQATVVTTAESYTLDAKAAEVKLRELGVDGRWFAKHKKVRAGSISIRVTARKDV